MDFSVQLPLLNVGFQRPPDDDDSFCSPREVVDLVVQMGRIALDPFSNPMSIVPADVAWDITHGDLTETESWDHGGLVYVNWPYSQNARWARKTAHEGAAGVEIIGLCQSYTGSGWFQRYVMTADRICNVDGRLQFIGGASTARFDCAVPYWGPRPDEFVRIFSNLGRCYSPRLTKK